MLVKKHADMIIIADSGSTKTHWVAISGNGTRIDIISSGINPYYQSQEDIASDIRDNVKFNTSGESVEVYFYGAGCANDEKKAIVRNAFTANYPTALCHVESDLTGACRSLLQHNAGIACILGTGSNSCYYDGKDIVKNVSPLGFIIGVEGSGAVIGKTFIGDLLKKQTTAEIEELFNKEYTYSAGDIVEAVYRKSFPNRFLAQFTKFVAHAL
jgi:N-acetylglucosamine kinase-like BadF-type ATPase